MLSAGQGNIGNSMDRFEVTLSPRDEDSKETDRNEKDPSEQNEADS